MSACSASRNEHVEIVDAIKKIHRLRVAPPAIQLTMFYDRSVPIRNGVRRSGIAVARAGARRGSYLRLPAQRIRHDHPEPALPCRSSAPSP
jgi:hypothetical protein